VIKDDTKGQIKMPRFLAHMQLHGSSSSAAQPSSHGSIAETKLSGRVESPSAAPAPAPVARPGQIRLDGGPEPAAHGLMVVFVVRQCRGFLDPQQLLVSCISHIFLVCLKRCAVPASTGGRPGEIRLFSGGLDFPESDFSYPQKDV
jgi:hypothetical protein